MLGLSLTSMTAARFPTCLTSHRKGPRPINEAASPYIQHHFGHFARSAWSPIFRRRLILLVVIDLPVIPRHKIYRHKSAFHSAKPIRQSYSVNANSCASTSRLREKLLGFSSRSSGFSAFITPARKAPSGILSTSGNPIAPPLRSIDPCCLLPENDGLRRGHLIDTQQVCQKNLYWYSA